MDKYIHIHKQLWQTTENNMILQITYKQYLIDTNYWHTFCDQHSLALHLTQRRTI